MISLDTLQEICSGFAWANHVNPLKDNFEVDVTLPFPFFEALQRDVMETIKKNQVVAGDNVDMKAPMRFSKFRFPNGIGMNVKEGKDGIIIEVKKPIVNPAQLLFPFNSEGIK